MLHTRGAGPAGEQTLGEVLCSAGVVLSDGEEEEVEEALPDRGLSMAPSSDDGAADDLREREMRGTTTATSSRNEEFFEAIEALHAHSYLLQATADVVRLLVGEFGCLHPNSVCRVLGWCVWGVRYASSQLL
jgi:hypothetical protein